MTADRYALRREKLLQAISELESDQTPEAMLITDVKNVTWLTGFSGDSSYLLLGNDVELMISDSRYTIQIQEECPGLEMVIRTSAQPMLGLLSQAVSQAGITKLGFESHCTTVELYETIRTRLSEDVKSLELLPVSMAVEGLREIKDEYEIEETRKAIRIAEKGYQQLLASLIPDMTELQAAHDLEHYMRRFGAYGAGFEPIVAVGPRSALPHARPGHSKIQDDDFLLIDWGAETLSKYRSDMTRVVVTGKVSDQLREIYNIVLQAHLAAVDLIAPGALCKDVDHAARAVIEDAGYGEKFGHGLGHGLGLFIHEQPRFSSTSDQVLKPGMIVTVEPGIYLEGWGGVRIEDDILVTEDGHEVLCSLPKDFEHAVLN